MQFGIESVVFTIVSGWVMSMVVAESIFMSVLGVDTNSFLELVRLFHLLPLSSSLSSLSLPPFFLPTSPSSWWEVVIPAEQTR